MSITVYYNLYCPDDPAREAEIMTCYAALKRDPSVSRLVVLCEEPLTSLVAASESWPVGARPTFGNYFAAIRAHSRPDDVNVVINSDCIIDPGTTRKLEKIRPTEAYCITRHELKEGVPPRIDKKKTAESRRTHHYDMQDCWAIRGRPREGMWLDFPAGRLGCDNRLAFELRKAGYTILDPYLTIRVLHYHSSARSPARRRERVPRPYAYPRKFGYREVTHEWLWWGTVGAMRLIRKKLSKPAKQQAEPVTIPRRREADSAAFDTSSSSGPLAPPP